MKEILPHVEYVVDKFYSNWYECAGQLRKKLNEARNQLIGYENMFKEVKDKNRYIQKSLVAELEVDQIQDILNENNDIVKMIMNSKKK